MARKHTYRVFSGSLHERFGASRKKIQLFGGGYGNGKTAASIVQKCLPIARDYPGANILVARETFPKLNDTIRAEFLKWCPKTWIKSFPMSANSSNTCTLINGTKINFRYVQQQGKSNEQSTSNLLSATYDLIIVDQIEDPGITYKDFIDLLGRLRGKTLYAGNDPTMPRSGPRWFIPLTNPTRNWVYKRIVKPVHEYLQYGRISDDLLCERDENDRPILDDEGKPTLIIDIFEGSTYENKENLDEDFIKTLESTYRGQMRSRFLLGEWGAYEGLVYPDFNEAVHGVGFNTMYDYYNRLTALGYDVQWVAGYDYGIAVPSCFLLAFVDPMGNVCIIDGFYEKEMLISEQRKKIADICNKYEVEYQLSSGRVKRLIPWADPAIFRRGPGGSKTVGKSVAEMFRDTEVDAPKIMMQRGNNNIQNGIAKVQSYMAIVEMHQNPFTENYGAPHFYYNEELEFIADEINDYIWKPAAANSADEKADEPRDGNDHACDTIKYMLSRMPKIAHKREVVLRQRNPLEMWHEMPDTPERMRA